MTETTRKKVRLTPEKRLRRYISKRQAENAARAELSKTAARMSLVRLDDPENPDAGGEIVNVIACHEDYEPPAGHILVMACEHSSPLCRFENGKAIARRPPKVKPKKEDSAQ